MNSKDFISALRKVIREEVQTAVRTELDKFSSVLSESKKQVSAPTVTRYTESYKPKPSVQKKQYTSNPTLNDLLNETVAFKGDGPQVYMEEQIDYNDFAEWPTMNSNRMSVSTPKVVTDHDGRRIDMQQLAQTEAGAAVVDALTKDYSALMKAIDKKKGN